MEQPLVFASAMEALVRRYGGELGAPVRAELRALGLDLDKPPLAAYPAEVWLKALAVLAGALHPGEPQALALTRIGQGAVNGFFQTRFGSAAQAMSRLIGLRRTLGRLERTMRGVNNFSTVRVSEEGPRRVRLEIGVKPELLGQLAGQPKTGLPYVEGVVRGVVAASGEAGAKVEHLERGDWGLVLAVSW